MQDRWVSYIYRYTDHKRCENTGYIKVIKTNGGNLEEATIQIGLKLFKLTVCRCKIYLVYNHRELKLLQEVLVKPQEKDTITIKKSIPWSDYVAEGITLRDCNGVYFLVDDGECLASSWWDKEIDTKNLHYYEEPEEVPAISDKVAEVEPSIEVVEESPQIQDEVSHMFETYTKLPLFIDSPFTGIVKIIPQDIGKLPIGNWKLGSNSFLVHAYYKYKYLMLGKLKFRGMEKIVIGVPGVFTNKEKYMANMFGFSLFVPVKKADVMTGSFGYWVWEVLNE